MDDSTLTKFSFSLSSKVEEKLPPNILSSPLLPQELKVGEVLQNPCIQNLMNLYLQGFSLRQLSSMTGIPRTTIHRRIQKELKEKDLCIKTIPQRRLTTNLLRVEPYPTPQTRQLFPVGVFYSKEISESAQKQVEEQISKVNEHPHNHYHPQSSSHFELNEETNVFESRIEKGIEMGLTKSDDLIESSHNNTRITTTDDQMTKIVSEQVETEYEKSFLSIEDWFEEVYNSPSFFLNNN